MQAQSSVIEQPVPMPARPVAPVGPRAPTRSTRSHASYLAEASRRLATSVELTVTMETVAGLSVPSLGDACIVCLLADGHWIEDVAAKHADPHWQRLLAELADAAFANTDGWEHVLSVAESRRPLVLSRLASASMLTRMGASPALVHELGLKATALLPILHHQTGLPIGVLVLFSQRAQYFGAHTLRLAGELAELSALALEMGQIFGECRTTLAERQETLAVTVHDLMSPLSVIKGAARRLRRIEDAIADADAIGDLRNRLETIDAAANRIAAALLALLRSAQPDAQSPQRGTFERTDLVTLARRVAAEQQVDAAEHTLLIAEAPDHLVGHWNANQLERALTNLLSNAVKYSPTGSVVELMLSDLADEDGAWAVLKVKDVGAGIPAADLPFVLEPFRRGTNVGDAEGIGLGLASVWQTVKAHAGRLLIDSREGEGTCVTVRLPLDAAVTQ